MGEYLRIIRRNLFTPIVIAVLLLAVGLLLFRQYRDAWFISVVIIVNTLFAIVQEIRARRALHKLELINAPRARRLTGDEQYEDIAVEAIRVGDSLLLEAGDSIPADGSITLNKGLECDESILTGESAPVFKHKGAIVYAGSTVVAGTATMRVTAIGSLTRAGEIMAKLKSYRPTLTPLQKHISHAISVLTVGAFVIAGIIFVTYRLAGYGTVAILQTMTSAAVTVVPEGLLLASSVLLAYGSVRLARARVLPQKLSAIEAMAVLDTLAVDKTGTLTSDIVTLDHIEVAHGDRKRIEISLAILAREAGPETQAGSALLTSLELPGEYTVDEILAFSSARKTSGVRFTLDGISHSLLLGAPEYLEALAPIPNQLRKVLDRELSRGKRVLLAVEPTNANDGLREVTSAQAVGFVVLENGLRTDVESTVAYLQGNGVRIRVISGDNPLTVSAVAKAAGIYGAKDVITGAELSLFTDDEWSKAVLKHSIFARVLPEQKERLIRTFQEAGQFTGMVGDGVNDALAIKQADLGVAMFSGSAATRKVADIVLLSNSFTSLPIGMKLGNQIMQSIELVAMLSFNKIAIGILLVIATAVVHERYPFLPRHVTFMNIFLLTLPTIMFTLFAFDTNRRIDPRRFWKDTLFKILPISLMSGACLTFVYLWLVHFALHTRLLGIRTTLVLLATLFGILTVFYVPKLMGAVLTKRARFARLLYILICLIIVSGAFGSHLARDFFDFAAPAATAFWSPVIVILLTVVGQLMYVLQIAHKAPDQSD